MDQHSANTIETIKGKNNILAIAPHGIHKDDKNTGILASLMAEHLGCFAVINEKYKKPRNGKKDFVDLGQDIADLNRLDVIKKEKVLMEAWLNPIIEFKNEIVKNYGSCLVILLHGIKDKNIEGINSNPDILLGTGLPDRRSVQEKIVDEITKSLRDEPPVNAIETDNGSYAAWDEKNLNQLFTGHGTLNLRDDKVESIQLEIKRTGFRNEEHVNSTAKKFTSVLKKLSVFKSSEVSLVPSEEKSDDAIALVAFDRLTNIFFSHYKNALIEAGKYIIKTFYDDDIELLRKKKPVKEKSLNKLIQIIQDKRGDAPKKSWFYNAINLVIDEYDNESFQTYGKLNTSQKLLLLPVHNDEIKKELIEESVENKYSTRELRERIQGLKKPRTKTLTQVIERPEQFVSNDFSLLRDVEKLKALSDEETTEYAKQAEAVIKEIGGKISEQYDYLEQYDGFIQTLKYGLNDDSENIYPKNEWGEYNISWCTGCSNNCLYCYAKASALRHKHIQSADEWATCQIRQDNVLKNCPKFPGQVLTPSSHDILPENLYASLIVITKLLKSGNQLIITSKPRLEIIEVLCKELRPFKPHFIFRFTIGANNNDILSFWEPNAPSYKERKEALKLAFDKKFKTSVSVEPMLDPDNIEELINDLLPYITDSIWLGKMTGTNELADRLQRDEVKQAIEKIESGQTDEKLKAFYERHKENPKIKYKDSINEIVGIDRITRPGRSEPVASVAKRLLGG